MVMHLALLLALVSHGTCGKQKCQFSKHCIWPAALCITLVLMTGGDYHLRPVPQHEDNRKHRKLVTHKTPAWHKHFVGRWPFRPPWRNGQCLFNFSLLSAYTSLSRYTQNCLRTFFVLTKPLLSAYRNPKSVYTKLSAYSFYCQTVIVCVHESESM